MSSLRGRLTLHLVVTLIAVFALQWALVSLSIRRIVENQMTTRLAHDVESLLAEVSIGADGRISLNPPMNSPVFHQPLSGHYYRIQIGKAVLRSRSLWDADLALPPVAPGDTVRLHLAGPAGQPLLVLAEGFTKQGAHLTIAVAEDLAPVQADIGRFQQAYLALTLVLLAVLIALQRYGVRRALRPLEGVRMDLRQLARGETERIGEEVPEEVRPLVREVNHLLDLLARRLGQSRTALGNLAHALKTPLTLLMRLAEEPETRASPVLRERMIAQTSTIRSLIERELKRAQLAGRGGSGARFRPAARPLEAEEATRVLAGYEHRNRLLAPLVRGVLSRLAGFRYDGSAQARARLVTALPLLALSPRPPAAR